MLKKEICIRCIREKAIAGIVFISDADKDFQKCPLVLWISLKNEPPEKCPYELEHILESQNVK